MLLSFPRSGSSLLRAMLNSHPDIAILPEPYWMMRLMKALEADSHPLTREIAASYLERHVTPRWYGNAGLAAADVVPLLPPGSMSGSDLVAAIGRAYARRSGKERWGVKYPGVQFRLGIPRLLAFFPEARLVFLARDPRDIYLSQLKARLRDGLQDLYLFSLLWVLQATKILRDLRRAGNHALILRYEDLVQDPGGVLVQICRLTGLSSSPESLQAMLSYQRNVEANVRENPLHQNLAKPVLAENRAGFLRKLSPAQIRRTEAVAGHVLRELGYPPSAGRAGIVDYLAISSAVAGRLITNTYGIARGTCTISGILKARLRRRDGE